MFVLKSNFNLIRYFIEEEEVEFTQEKKGFF
jgi:hypothetical protein